MMLNWPNLTVRQKAACLLMLALGVMGAMAAVLGESQSPAKLAEAAGAICLLLSVLFDPAWVQGGRVSDIPGKRMPRSSMYLAALAVALFAVSGLVARFVEPIAAVAP